MSKKSHQIRNEILSIEVGLNLLSKLLGSNISSEQQQVLDHLHMTIEERGARIDVSSLPAVTGHGPQLVQLFQNLIGNGIKYNEQPEPMIKVTAERLEEDWLFTIDDNGIGIPEDKLKAVFEPFQRLWSQDTYEGTGLGLAICRKIVERHGGRIWCTSEPGSGSRFYFTMPPATGGDR